MLKPIDTAQLRRQFEDELTGNILKFWIDNAVDEENGGFYGYISNDRKADKYHDKASVLNSRILWTFSAAFRIYGNSEYLSMATRAYDYITGHFIDPQYSGVYWMVDCKGATVNTKKQVYAIAFAIYGLTEYFKATGNRESLDKAIELYNALEEHAYDRRYMGYTEAFSRDWSPVGDMSLSEKDMNSEKSMNTHLHILEAYTSLFRVWKDSSLEKALRELIRVTVDHIVDPKTHSFGLFFDGTWNSRSGAVSYGHDIEGSWLLCEAAGALGDSVLLDEARRVSVNMAWKVLENGIDRKHGGLFFEGEHGAVTKPEKEWWPQAEAVVCFYNAYQLAGDEAFFKAALDVWDFIGRRISDRVRGEWFWGVSEDGLSLTGDEKAGPWKCPYHNGRMCLEMLRRLR